MTRLHNRDVARRRQYGVGGRRVAVLAVAALLLLGADCETVETPGPVGGHFVDDGYLVLGTFAGAATRLASLERFVTTPSGAEVRPFELHFDGNVPEVLRAWLPRSDRSFSVAGAIAGDAWIAVIGDEGSVRSQQRLRVDGFEHLIEDGLFRDGALSVFAGTAMAASDEHAMWLSTRLDGSVEWSFRSNLNAASVAEIIAKPDGAGVLVGSAGTGEARQPFVASLSASGEVDSAFLVRADAETQVIDAEAVDAESLLLVGVQPEGEEGTALFVSQVSPRSGQVAWSRRILVQLGAVASAEVAPVDGGALVAAAVTGYGAVPGADADVLLVFLSDSGRVEGAWVHGSLDQDIPLELGAEDGGAEPPPGVPQAETPIAQLLLRVGTTVESAGVYRDRVEGCGRRFEVAVVEQLVVPEATALALSAVAHPLSTVEDTPAATQVITTPLFACRF